MSAPIRAPDVLRQMAIDFMVENAFAFLPHRRLVVAPPGNKAPALNIGGIDYVATSVLTLCNAYVHAFTVGLECPIPPIKANEQLVWLGSNEGKMAGWSEVTLATAVERAGLGYPTVAVAYEAPHGHIGMVMPSPATDPLVPYVSAAGIVNRHYCRMVESFAQLTAGASFFTHQ